MSSSSLRDQVSGYERAFAIIGLLLMFRALRPLYTPLPLLMADTGGMVWAGAYDVTAGNLMFQVPTAAVFAISGMLLFRDRQKAIELLSQNKMLVLFIGIALASTTWAQDPDTALRRAIALTGTSLFGFHLAVRYSHRQLIELAGIAAAITVFQTFFISALIPSMGVHGDAEHAGAWRGVLGHKNDAGRVIVFAALVAFVCWRDKIGHYVLGWPTLIVAAFVVVMTASKTSLLVLLALTMSVWMFRTLRRSNIPVWLRAGVLTMLAVVPLIFFVASFYESGLEMMGRNATLTGRTDIWEKAISVGVTQPWLGFGYRTFWVNNGPFIWFMPGHGHNSYLDLWLELGFVGLALFGAATISGVRRAFWRLTHTNDALGMWFLLYLFYLGVFGLTSPAFPQQGTIEWVMYCVVLLQLAPKRTAEPLPQVPYAAPRSAGAAKPRPMVAGR